MDTFIQACHFAAQKHIHQRRKDKYATPYINHPIEVAYFISSIAVVNNEDVLAAAVLHDTVEDTETTYDDLIKEFGEGIANVVMECSDDKSQTKVERKKLQIEHAETSSFAAKLVKLGDKLSNLLSLDNSPPAKWSAERIYGYRIWSYAVWKKLVGTSSGFDKVFQGYFDRHGITKLTSDEVNDALNRYYKLLMSDMC